MASFQTFLHVGGKRYELLYSDLDIHQKLDGLGRPASPTFGGAFNAEINMPDSGDPTLFDWMFDPAKILNCKVVLKRIDSNATLKTIKFYNAYCVGMAVHFDGTANASSCRLSLRISPEQFDVNGLFHDNRWPDESPIQQMADEDNPTEAKQPNAPVRLVSAKAVQPASIQAVAAVQTVVNSDCSESVRSRLQRDVTLYCKGTPTKCFNGDSCPTLEGKMETINACIKARTTINMKCFKGGDEGHKQAIQEKINSLVNCQTIFFQKCGPKTTPVPQTVPQPVPEPPVSQPDPSFMKKMEELTGLTGAALIIYLIISEGSRLFPPRNAIPIP